MTGKDDEAMLKELILDDDFTSLQNLVNEEVNLMDILKVSRKELQHSNFLAWLFDPKESHNLGDYALKEFIKIYFRENEYKNLGADAGLSVFDFVQLDFDDLEIRREYKNIDLILLSRKREFCVVIENKIFSGEREGQLKKYREVIEHEYRELKYKIFIYLSLEEQQISEDEQDYYVCITYDNIIKLIEQIISGKQLNLADKTKFVFEQYLQTLKTMLNKNEEIEEISQKLYKKYKAAFDLVIKYAVPNDNVIWTKLKSLIEAEKSIRPFHTNKSMVRFQPCFLYDNLERLRRCGLVSENDDLGSNWLFMFEFHLLSDRVTFFCKIGGITDMGEPARDKLYDIYNKHRDVFTSMAKKKKFNRWHIAYQKQILSHSEITDDSLDKEELIEKRFRELMDNVFPKMIAALNEEVGIIDN